MDIKSLAEVEREHILETLHKLKGNRTQTAKALKIGLRTLHRKLIAYGMTTAQVPHPQYHGGKQVYCEETGKVYNSLTEAAHATGLNAAEVSVAVRYGTSIKGLTFRRLMVEQLQA